MDVTDKINRLTLSIEDVNIKGFVEYTLLKFKDTFFTAPSSSDFHHAYLEGNYIHTQAVSDIVSVGSRIYGVDKDLAIAGADLHDIAKSVCYAVNKKGRVIHKVSNPLEAHFVIGNKIISDVFGETEFLSQEQFDAIQHILMSHHGPVATGHGSFVDPLTLEAKLVSSADQFDAIMSFYREREV
jgi:3'-5' exoribonuclease